MLKSRDQMWTRLSQLTKDLPSWLAAGQSDRSATATPARPNEAKDPSTKQCAQDQARQQGVSRGRAHVLFQKAGETFSAAAITEPDDTKTRFADSLQIPICDSCPDTESRQTLQDKGQFLARQDRWPELIQQIRQADQSLHCSPGGLPEADLLAYGARADVINAVEHALEDRSSKPGAAGEDRVLIEGVMALEALRREHAQDPHLTALVALAHIDIAWIWRAASPQPPLPQARLRNEQADAHLRRASAHFERAATLLAPLKAQCRDSAFLSAAHCALYAGQSADTLQVADAYGILIDQNPNNPRHMRALGTQMLPRANGSYAALELEARRCAARTQQHWGAGGYTWVYFDAITLDDQACARVDYQFFMDGLQDILCTDPSQEMINLLAAYCALTLRHNQGHDPQADATRAKISQAARWLVRSHLRELHPLIWAHASEGFDNNARITSLRRFAARGQAEALRCIAEVFREELDSGHKIAFSPEGFDLTPA